MDKVSYALGMSIGRQLEQMSATELNIDDFSQAIKDVFARSTHLTDSEAEITVQSFFQQKAEEQAKATKAEGENFLAENAKKPGVVTLPSGLQYQVLREGNGRKPSATDQVECHYEGTLINGQVFDSGYRRGETATFGLNQVIKGWTRSATHAGRCKVPFLYPLQPCLWRAWSRPGHSALRSTHLRR